MAKELLKSGNSSEEAGRRRQGCQDAGRPPREEFFDLSIVRLNTLEDLRRRKSGLLRRSRSEVWGLCHDGGGGGGRGRGGCGGCSGGRGEMQKGRTGGCRKKKNPRRPDQSTTHGNRQSH